MTKHEMENETNNKDVAMNEGKVATMNENKGPVQTKGNGPGQGHADDAGVLAQVQETGKDIATKSLGAIGEKTRSTTEGYRSDISGGLHMLAEGLRQTSSTFNKGEAHDKPLSSAGARYIGDLAEKVEGVSGYFERMDTTALLRDVKGFAKRNPTVFVGGAFALGFAVSRLIRSSTAASPTRG